MHRLLLAFLPNGNYSYVSISQVVPGTFFLMRELEVESILLGIICL